MFFFFSISLYQFPNKPFSIHLDPDSMTPKHLILPLLCAVSVFGTGASVAQDVAPKPTQTKELRGGFSMPGAWTRRGVVLERQKDGKDFSVSGDPCIVWDEAIQGWRMVLFYDPPGHAQAVCLNREDIEPGQWKLEGPLPVADPQAVGSKRHLVGASISSKKTHSPVSYVV